MEFLPTAIENGYMANQSEKTRKQLGKRIQRLRKSLGYSQEEFADIVGISRTRAGHIEQGRKSPSLALLERLAKALKVKVKDLFS